MLTVVAAALAFQAATDPCAPETDCTSCIAKVSQGCGWCSPSDVIYEDGTKGNRCANANDPKKWFCLGKLMTAKCEIGYVCTGPPDYKCVLSGKPGEGTVDLHACIDTCTTLAQWKCDETKFQCAVCGSGDDKSKCHSHDECSASCRDESLYQCDPVQAKCVKCPKGQVGCKGESECDNSCTQSYQCNLPADTTKEPSCDKCSDPTGKKCSFASEATCKAGDGKTTFGCDWQYECQCNANGPTCAKTTHGIPKLEWCQQQCKCDKTYTCDETAKTCKLSNSTGGGGQTNITQCNANCPSKVQNHTTPFELRGVWRGYAIQGNFKRGEWVANISTNSTTITKPDGSVYFSGLTSTYAPAGSGAALKQLWVESVAGIVGTIKLLYGDYGLEPELQYLQLAVDESAIGTPPKDYDTAMVKSTDKVLGMYKCKSDSKNCKFHLPKHADEVVENRRELQTPTGDACNAYSDCKTCLAATAGDLTCGWCTSPVDYVNVSGTKFQCAGWQSGKSHAWKCYGQFRTATCHDYCCDTDAGTCSECADGKTGYPTMGLCGGSCKPGPSPFGKCGINGTYRGLEIDLGYQAGEWTADFNVTSQMAKFTQVASGYSYSGKIGCTALDKDDGQFELTLTNGTKLYGIYATGSVQAETEGLSWALSQLGSTVAPTGWDSAMLGVNATVFAYTKCADYKAGVCKF